MHNGGLHQRWYDLFGARLSRRDFVRVGRDVASCIALAALPPPRDLWQPRARANPFPLGVASGDPLDTGVVLWTRIDASSIAAAPANLSARWEVAEDDGFRRIVRKGSSSAPSALGHSVHAEVDGLRPGRDYWYRFNTGGEVSATGRTRTAPAPSASPDRFRFAFVSCQNYEQGYYTAYRHLASEELDLVAHLGDYIYETHYGADQVRNDAGGEVVTLDQYRARHALYRADADLQAAHAAFAWIVTPDDHDVANNYANAISEDNVPHDQFLLRRAAAYQAYYEFLPLRRASMPAGPDIQLYRRLRVGTLAEFHVLDTRQFRSDQPCGDRAKPRCAGALDPGQTLMGTGQEAWLASGLRASKARWNVLANQVMMAQLAGGPPEAPTYRMDQWDGYVAARTRLLKIFAEVGRSNPIVITGDIHSNWVADLKLDVDDPSSPTVATEFVGTSISSGGDGSDEVNAAALARNPHVKFNNRRRGYVRATLTPSVWISDYRTVPYVSRPGAPIETKASFIVESGKPGVTQ